MNTTTHTETETETTLVEHTIIVSDYDYKLLLRALEIGAESMTIHDMPITATHMQELAERIEHHIGMPDPTTPITDMLHLKAWRDTMAYIDPLVEAAMHRYVNRCESGGMKPKRAGIIRSAVGDAARLNYFRDGIAMAVHDRIGQLKVEHHGIEPEAMADEVMSGIEAELRANIREDRKVRTAAQRLVEDGPVITEELRRIAPEVADEEEERAEERTSHDGRRAMAQAQFDKVRARVKEDVREAMAWFDEQMQEIGIPTLGGDRVSLRLGIAYDLTKPGSGAKAKAQIDCEFACPSWSGSHVGQPMDTASEAIVMAVCEYRAGL